tara:strand:- start:3266 stop:3454 length:189 start_codon:yes stop_codon:yes gene_type:complete
MKPFKVGRIVTNPITDKEAEIVHVTDKGVYLRDLDLPVSSKDYDFIPGEETPGMNVTTNNIR